MTTNRTPNLGLAIPEFNQAPWHDLVNNNMKMLDAIIYSALGISNFRGAFVNSTEVLLGERYFDPESGQLYQAVTTYVTSPAPTTFAEERLLFPTYWESVNEVVLTALEDARTAAIVAELWATKLDAPVTPEPNAKFSARFYANTAEAIAGQVAIDREVVTDTLAEVLTQANLVDLDRITVLGAVAGIADAKITWRGPWQSGNSYSIRDAAERNGTSYIAKVFNNATALNEPGSGANWTDFWEVLALKGDQGDEGPAGPGTGDIIGPTGATNNRLAVFDGTTGKLLKDGGVAVDGLATVVQGTKADTALQPGAQIPWTDVTDKPSTFAPTAHTHPATEISDSTAAGRAIVTAADVAAQRTLLSVETTAQLNSRDTSNRQRVNHTGTQAASTITGLAPIATSGNAADLTTGTLPAGRFTDVSHGSRAGGDTHPDATTVVSGFMSGSDKTKLNGVATGATANDTNASLRDRTTHTGTQPAATISDFNSAVAATPAVAANTAKTSNATHTGDVTGATALTIGNNVVTNAKLADMATATIKGRNTAGTGDPQDLTAAQVRTLLNIADGATANATNAQLRDRTTHTGEQPTSTITGLDATLADTLALLLSFNNPYTQTDAELLTVPIPASQQTMLRMPSAAGQVAPANIVTRWRKNALPGGEPFFTTQGGTNWTPAEFTQEEMLSILNSVLDGAFTDAILPGRTNFGDGTAALPSMRFILDPDTGIYRPADNQIGFATAGVQRLLLSNANFAVNVPIIGTAVTQSNADSTAGRLLKVGDFGVGAPLLLTGATDLKDRSLAPGLYTYVTSVVAGGPETAAWTHTLLVMQSATDSRRTFISLRTTGTGSLRAWFGAQSTATGAIFWTRMLTDELILGTVSQTGGVPTGAIIQRGSNANGEFVRYADGTQICTFTAEAVACATAKGALFGNAATQTWTFPIAFTAPPAVHGSGGGVQRWVACGVPTTTQLGWETLSHTSSAVASSPTLIAIGRWF